MRPFIYALAVALALCTTACLGSKGEAPMDVLEAKKQAQYAESEGQDTGGGLADERSRNEMTAQDAPAAVSAPAKPGAPAPEPAPAEELDPDSAKSRSSDKQPAQGKAKDATAGMYIIRRGNVTIEVPDVKAGVQKVTAMVKGVGGFVSESNFEATEGSTPNAKMTLRVPANKFDQVLDGLGGVGTVFARHVGSEDVTLQFVDTQSRIRNLQKEETQILGVLQRTGKLLDVLEVERELARVRGEIEQAQGRIRQLSNLVSLATIEVSLSEKVQVVSASPWASLPASVENAWKDTERNLASAMAWAAATAIWLLAYFLPLALPVVAVYLVAGWALRGWLVAKKKVLPEAWFQRLWIGLGLALISLWWPPLAGIVVVAAIAAAVLAAGSALVARFFVRKKDID